MPIKNLDHFTEFKRKFVFIVTVSINKYEGMIDSIVGPFIMVLFGASVPQPEARSKRKELIQALSEAIGQKVSIVHGHSECLVGTLGGECRMSYTALIPGFKEILNRLSGLPYGGVLEIEKGV